MVGLHYSQDHVRIMLLCVLVFLSRSETGAAAESIPWRELSVEKLHIRSSVTYRFAITEVVSEIHNNVDVSKEARFDVRLPKTAFISNFTMVIDGVEYPGHMDAKERARERYEEERMHGQSAGYVGVQPRNTDRFKVSVNVAANSTVTFKLTYEDLLQRRLGLYELVIYIDPGQIVPDMRVDVLIVESREITELNIPNIRNDLMTDFAITDENPYAEVKILSDSSVQILFAPSPSEQIDVAENGIAGQFIVNYDVQRESKGGDIVLGSGGYFVHFFAPPDMEPMPKSIMFVLDVSGSMIGKKMKQMKDAMVSILQDLNPEDDFNIVKFSSRVSRWRDQMVPVSDTQVKEARWHVWSLITRSSTNINEALLSTLSFSPFTKTRKVPMIFFLTDGNPTAGERNGDRLLANVIQSNKDYFKGKAAIFCLAFGSDADFDLVKRISSTNNGLARRIYTDSDASIQLAGFYNEISSPLLSDVHIKYLKPALQIESIARARSQTYFLGSELVMSGRVADHAIDNGTSTIDLEITANDVNGGFTIDVSLIPEVIAPAERLLSIPERMWAYLTINQLLKDSKNLDMQERKANLKSEALKLALKYKFVTELTAMVVTKPSVDNKKNNTTDKVGRQYMIPEQHTSRPRETVTHMGRTAISDPGRKTHDVGVQGDLDHLGQIVTSTTTRRPTAVTNIRTPEVMATKFPPVAVVPVRGQSGWEKMCIFRLNALTEQVTLLSTKDVSIIGTLAPVIKEMEQGKIYHHQAFIKLILHLSGSKIQIETSHTKIGSATFPWWRPALVNESNFQVNITSSKQLVVTTDDGFHLTVSRVGLRSRRSRSKPYLSVALLDAGFIDPNPLLGAFNVSIIGTLAPVIKEMTQGKRYLQTGFMKLILNLSGSEILITASQIKIGKDTLLWKGHASANEANFQVNITSSKQLVVTADNGFHLTVSRIGQRSRMARSKPYLMVALLNVSSIDPNSNQGAFSASIVGTLVPVIKEKNRVRKYHYPAFTKLSFNISGSEIKLTTSRMEIGNATLSLWQPAFVNESRFQVNITSSKQIVITADDGFHLIVSRVALKSGSTPYLGVALYDTNSIDLNSIQGAFKAVMGARRIQKRNPALSFNPGQNSNPISSSPSALLHGEGCWQLAHATDQFVIEHDKLSLRVDSA